MSTVYVNLNCEKCGELYSIRRDSYYHRKSKGRPNLCDKCRKVKYKKDMVDWHKNLTEEERQQRYENISTKWKENWQNKTQEEKDKLMNHLHEGRDNYYSNLTDEEREKDSERRRKVTQKMWDDCSPEEKDRRIKVLHEGRQRYYDSLSEEEKNAWIQKMCDGFKAWRENMTEEEKRRESVERRKRFFSKPTEEQEKTLAMLYNEWQRWYALLSKPEKKRRMANLRDKLKEWYSNLNSIQREHHKTLAREYWTQLNEEEFQNWLGKYISGKDNYYKTKPFQLYGIELTFATNLQNLGIEYERQYHSCMVHSDFEKKFPFDPIRNGRVSPYHAWDFRVKTKQGDIFVDLDGSLHGIDWGNYMVDGISVGAAVRFNDSQRPYQTDGLEAYVIQAHDDLLCDNTKVIRLEYGSDKTTSMTYKDFLNILQFMNMSDKEIKEIKK